MNEELKKKRIFQIAKELNISHLEIMKFLKDLFNPIQVVPSSKLDISIDSKEALGFAIFAVAHIKKIPGNIPSVTGANNPAILGKMTS